MEVVIVSLYGLMAQTIEIALTTWRQSIQVVLGIYLGSFDYCSFNLATRSVRS